MALKVEHLEMFKKEINFTYNWVQHVYTRHQNKASVQANNQNDEITDEKLIIWEQLFMAFW